MSNRTVIVTGANSGLGRATAAAFAGAGAHVVLAVRNRGKGEAAAAAMHGRTEVRELDLASLPSIHRFTEAWDGEIDILINNAGIMIPPLTRTVDGFEDAVRHQPSGPLRAHQPAAQADHRTRGDGLFEHAQSRKDRL